LLSQSTGHRGVPFAVHVKPEGPPNFQFPAVGRLRAGNVYSRIESGLEIGLGSLEGGKRVLSAGLTPAHRLQKNRHQRGRGETQLPGEAVGEREGGANLIGDRNSRGNDICPVRAGKKKPCWISESNKCLCGPVTEIGGQRGRPSDCSGRAGPAPVRTASVGGGGMPGGLQAVGVGDPVPLEFLGQGHDDPGPRTRG